MTSRTTKTIRRIPNPPLGKYPQLALWGQLGSAPTSNKIKTIRRIVEILIGMPFPSTEHESDNLSMQADGTHNSGQ